MNAITFLSILVLFTISMLMLLVVICRGNGCYAKHQKLSSQLDWRLS